MTNLRSESQTSDIRYLKGVGPKRALALERLGVKSPRDLFYFFPRRYEDRSRFKAIAEIQLAESVTLRGKILSVQLKPLRRINLLEVLIGDDSGTLPAVWFNQPYLKKYFAADQEVILYGKVDFYQNRLQLISPEYEIIEHDQAGIHTGRITPIYPLTEGLFQRSLRTSIYDALQSQLDKTLEEFLPESFRNTFSLTGLREAIREMHFPGSFERLAQARRRMVFDEFLLFELTLLRKMERMRTQYKSFRFSADTAWEKEFIHAMPFELTSSQVEAVKDLRTNLNQSYPMNRLLMGDVGSGKTVVAAYGLFLAARNRYQGALLVPTEILAEQHFQTLQKLLAPFSIPMALLTSSTSSQRRERILAELSQGKLLLLVGTHALLQETVKFHSLGLVIIDEQHKFGVHQRCHLLNHDPRPHQLVMTATPIPRTLALTVYGDLDVSTLRELPRGRKPIKTYWITRVKENEVLKHILQKIQGGEQGFFIFPLIDETEKKDLLAATREYERLKNTVFSKIPMGLVHGRLSPEEREQTMKRFRRGEISLLVATSVIEVGVDNPNATMMVIENAERFGLAQLHQMRGRIGRGTHESECFLFGEPKTEEGKKRLRILTKSQDGFMIADEDLRLRGPGDFWGVRQSGEPLFRVANPVEDYETLVKVREIAMDLVNHKKLEREPDWKIFAEYLELNPIRY